MVNTLKTLQDCHEDMDVTTSTDNECIGRSSIAVQTPTLRKSKRTRKVPDRYT